MTINIVQGTGSGPDTLSAFDSALTSAGISNFNLIKMSSVIPLKSEIVVSDMCIEWYKNLRSEQFIGNRLYVVMSDIRTNRSNVTIGCGLGWYQNVDGSGIFVEHHSLSEGDTKKEVYFEVKNRIKQSLEGICQNRDWVVDTYEFKYLINTTYVESKPTSALVVAVYDHEEWQLLS